LVDGTEVFLVFRLHTVLYFLCRGIARIHLILILVLHWRIHAFHTRISFLHLRFGVFNAFFSQIYCEYLSFGIGIIILSHVAVALLGIILAGGGLIVAFVLTPMAIYALKAMTASAVKASVGTFVTVSVEVMVVTAFALFNTVAISAASIAEPVSTLARVLNGADRAILVNAARLIAFIATPIAVCLSAFGTFLENKAISSVFLGIFQPKCFLVAFVTSIVLIALVAMSFLFLIPLIILSFKGMIATTLIARLGARTYFNARALMLEMVLAAFALVPFITSFLPGRISYAIKFGNGTAHQERHC
jgi:hypothetical protein